MPTTIAPVFYSTKETKGYLTHLSDDIKAALGKDADLLLERPCIYLHVWQSKNDKLRNQFSIYVGETNDIIERTKEHWNQAYLPIAKLVKGNWQYHMAEDKDDMGSIVVPTVYFFGHPCFHKSLTLDIENKLIDFCLAMQTAHTYNGRSNPQGCYSGDENLDPIFSKIWKQLKAENKDLFLPESSIIKSAIYKASPNHVLTPDQKDAKQKIIDRTVDAIVNNKTGQLIFVEGEAGTGKTVLTSSAFYGILENDLMKSLDIKSYMLVNHDEQLQVYQNMARQLGYTKKTGYKDDIVLKPTTFLNRNSVFNARTGLNEPDFSKTADIVFVDESHLLWDQNNQSYSNKYNSPQLDEIMKRSRVTVVMFDENQFLDKRQFYEKGYLDSKRNLAKSQGPDPAAGENNYILLVNQLRMACSKDTMTWIDDFTKNQKIEKILLDSKYQDTSGYEVKFFDDPSIMHDAIIKKTKNADTQLSRVVATYDWPFNEKNSPLPPKKYWDVTIGSFSLPWNEQVFNVDLKGIISSRQKMMYSALDWAEKDYTINEAGSTFTIQGFDLSFVGVILGPSVRYDKIKKQIYFEESKRAWDEMKGTRTMRDGTKINVTDDISRHELRVLLTRGTKGLYIYACDDDLREALKNAVVKI